MSENFPNARLWRPRKIMNKVRKDFGFSCMRLISGEICNYYYYQDRYEFTTKPLNYYERQKIKLRLRRTDHLLDELDNCHIIKIGKYEVTKYKIKFNLIAWHVTNPLVTICNLKSLKYLHINYKPIIELPLAIGNLRSLRELSLSHNNLKYVPPSIGNLKSLVYLYLHDNKLTNLPLSIGNLKSLRHFSLSTNQLTNLPPLIGNLQSLEYLSLSNNQFDNTEMLLIQQLLPHKNLVIRW